MDDTIDPATVDFLGTEIKAEPFAHHANNVDMSPFKMVLIDGSQLAALMIRNNVGVRTAETLHGAIG